MAIGMTLNTQQVKELEEASKPLIEFLRSNFHPHVTVIVTGQSAEMVEGLATVLPAFSGSSSSGNGS